MLTRLIAILFLGLAPVYSADLSTIDSIRSKILTSAVSIYFNTRGYGKVDNVIVDTTKKTLRFNLFPEGEKQPLNVDIGSYTT